MLLTRSGRPAANLWTLDPDLVQFNHGSYGAVPRAAQEEAARLRAEMERDPQRWFGGISGRVGTARAALAGLLDLPPERVGLARNASAAATATMSSLPLAVGSEVVITDHAYGAVAMGVARAVERAGGRLVTAAVDLDADADTARAAVMAAVTERTAMIVIDHITSPTARLLPVRTICAAARERGILSVVDGAHAPLLLPGAAQEAEADVWFGNLHKFGCAPRGTAVLVAHEDVAQRLYPLVDSWGAREPFPQRFDRQASDDYSSWLAAPFSVQHLETELGWDRIRDHATRFAAQTVQRVGEALGERLGADVGVDVGMPVGPIRLLRLPGLPTEGLVPTSGRLRAVGLSCALTTFRGEVFLRVSPHAYSVSSDIDRLVEQGVPILAEACGA